jgi:hypothetical protein
MALLVILFGVLSGLAVSLGLATLLGAVENPGNGGEALMFPLASICALFITEVFFFFFKIQNKKHLIIISFSDGLIYPLFFIITTFGIIKHLSILDHAPKAISYGLAMLIPAFIGCWLSRYIYLKLTKRNETSSEVRKQSGWKNRRQRRP